MSSPTRKSLRISIIEGVFAQAQMSLTSGLFLANYFQDAQVSNVALGILFALPHVASVLALASPTVVRWLGSRRMAVCWSITIHRLRWRVVLALFFIPMPRSVFEVLLILTLLATYSMGAIAGNSWTTWIGDVVPERVRGKFFSVRNIFLNLVHLAVVFVAAAVLKHFQDAGTPGWGYLVCFGVAIGAGLVSTMVLSKQHEPPREPPPAAPLLTSMGLTWQQPTVRAFLIFMIIWQFSLGVSAPFFEKFMIKDLAMDPSLMAWAAILTAVGSIASLQLWVRLVQRFGPEVVVVVSGLVIALHLWLWMLPTKHDLTWIWVLAVLGGVGWSGFNMGSFNCLLELGQESDRIVTVSVVNLTVGVTFPLGSILAGIFISVVPHQLFGTSTHLVSTHVLFIISAVGRFLAVVWFVCFCLDRDTLRQLSMWVSRRKQEVSQLVRRRACVRALNGSLVDDPPKPRTADLLVAVKSRPAPTRS